MIPCARIYTLTTWKKTQFIHFNSCPVCLLVCGGFLYCWFVVIFGLCFSVCSDSIRTIPLRSVQFTSDRFSLVWFNSICGLSCAFFSITTCVLYYTRVYAFSDNIYRCLKLISIMFHINCLCFSQRTCNFLDKMHHRCKLNYGD